VSDWEPEALKLDPVKSVAGALALPPTPGGKLRDKEEGATPPVEDLG